MGAHGDGDFYDSGWWASDNGVITYRFALDPGNYVVSTGHQEWWNSTRGIQITGVSVDADGKETEIGSTTFTLSGEKDAQKQTKIKVPKGSEYVLIKVNKASGSAPVLSWIGISTAKASADGNLLENGSFENGSQGWGTGSDGVIEENTDGSVPDGTHYLKDHGTDHGDWKGDGSSQSGIFVSPDTEYVLTGKAKVDSSSSPYYVGLRGDGKEVYSVFIPGPDFTEESAYNKYTYSVHPAATGWTDFEIRFTTGTTTDMLDVYTWIDDGYGYLDQLVLKKASEIIGGGKTYYVDSVNGDDSREGTSPETAWKTLSKASSVRNLTEGGKILLKAGCQWNGEQLSVRNAKGTEENPVVIGSYGEGEKPLINGNGAGWKVDSKEKLAAVHIYNCENIVVENLAVTNKDAAAAGEFEQSSKLLSGIVVENRDAGTLSNVTIRNNKIYDVNGRMESGAKKAAGGLIVVVTGGGKDHTGIVESRYDGLTISGNEVYNVCHEAIYMESVWAARTLVGGSSANTQYQSAGNSKWVGSSNVKIEYNYVHDVAGDGIVPINTTDALVQYNLIHNSADSRWDHSNNPDHAALWAWNADNVTFRYNEACHTSEASKGAKVGNDSMAFDFDYGVQNCVYEYNYSHDNLGGFLMLCPGPGATINNIARYNVSVNDGLYPGAPIIRMAAGKYGSVGVQIYNNTMYWADSGFTPALMPSSRWEGDVIEGVEVFNNIFYGPAQADTVRTDGVTYHHNALFGGAQDVYKAAVSDGDIVEADPKFADVAAYTEGTWENGKVTLGSAEGFRIADDSPCVNKGAEYPDAPALQPDALAGELVANGAEKPQRDYYKNPIQDGKSDMGAHEVTDAVAAAKDELQTTYDQAAAIKPAGFTEESYKALQTAMAEAKKVLDKEDAVQEEIEKQTELLKAAIKELKLDVLDKEPLEKLCEEARAIAKDGYTEESYTALQTAIAEAEDVLENGKTQKALDDAAEALQKAIDGLEKEPEPEKTVTGIEVTQNPEKTEYLQGEELDPAGLEIEVSYSDDTKETVIAEGFEEKGIEISGYDKDKIGQQVVTVKYGENTATFEVTVKEKEPEPEKTVTGIEVTQNPEKTEYLQGEELDPAGLEIEVSYSDDTKETVIAEGFEEKGIEISGYDKDKIGQQVVTVKYGENTATFEVTVKEKEPEPEKTVTGIRVSQNPVKTEYLLGEVFDPEGLELEVIYSDGSVDYVSKGYEISGYDETTSGEQAITVAYQGLTATFQIMVKAVKLLEDVEQQVTVAIPEDSDQDFGNISLKVEKIDTAGETVGETFAEITEKLAQELQITDVAVNEETATVLDISLIDENDQQVQPDGEVVVTILKPEGYSNKLKLYHKHGDGLYEILFKLRDSKELVFRVSEFSQFIIVDLERSADLPEVDKSGLEEALAEAGTLNPADYDETAWNMFEEVVKTAQSMYENPEAGQEEVDEQTEALKAALEELKKHPASGGSEEPGSAADKSLLEALLQQAQGLKKEDYTADSWEALQEALEAGNSVYADENATQEQVDAAAAALESAIKGLKDTEGPKNPQKDPSGDPEKPQNPGSTKNPGTEQNPGTTKNPGATQGGNASKAAPKTGDGTMASMQMYLLLIALAVITGCMYSKNIRRRR